MVKPNETPITLSFIPEVHERALAVAEALKTWPEASVWGRHSKALAFRLAVLRGLEALEIELGLVKPPPTPRAKPKPKAKPRGAR